MRADAMAPFGRALLAFLDGDAAAQLVVEREDGVQAPVPAAYFFRSSEQLSAIERAALDACRGDVLDIGAGAGTHTLVLQDRGLQVTALDICPEAVAVMRRRGVRDVREGDVATFDDGPFDTLLLLGHGIGMVEDLPGLEPFLSRARRLAGEAGRLLVHSLDVTRTADPGHLAYHAFLRAEGRYVGATRVRFAFAGERGPLCGWLHLDPDTLSARAARAGWTTRLLVQDESGDYLAELA